MLLNGQLFYCFGYFSFFFWGARIWFSRAECIELVVGYARTCWVSSWCSPRPLRWLGREISHFPPSPITSASRSHCLRCLNCRIQTFIFQLLAKTCTVDVIGDINWFNSYVYGKKHRYWRRTYSATRSMAARIFDEFEMVYVCVCVAACLVGVWVCTMKTHDRNDLKLGTVVLNTVSQPTDSGFTWLGTGFKFRELVLICISRECTYLLRTAVCVRSGSKWANIHHNADSVWVEPNTLPSVEVPQLQHGSHLHVCQLPGVGFGFSSWTVSVIIIINNIIIIIITPCLKKLTTFVFMITLAPCILWVANSQWMHQLWIVQCCAKRSSS